MECSQVSNSGAHAYTNCVLTSSKAYSAFQPALKDDAEKRAGTFQEHHQEGSERSKHNVLSQAIMSDLKEAKQEVTKEDGFAWGIRKALFGPTNPSKNDTQTSVAAVSQEEGKKSE